MVDERTETEDLRLLVEQVHAGVVLLEEILDREADGKDWVSPSRGRGRTESSAARYAWGQLSMAWINLCTMLLEDAEVEPWTIAPLVTRSSKGNRSSWEWGPDRSVEISVYDTMPHEMSRVRTGAIRVVDQPKEPRYTLDEARKLLEVCQAHAWEVDLDDYGRPRGVRCSTEGCTERRPLQGGQ